MQVEQEPVHHGLPPLLGDLADAPQVPDDLAVAQGFLDGGLLHLVAGPIHQLALLGQGLDEIGRTGQEADLEPGREDLLEAAEVEDAAVGILAGQGQAKG
jgi:hypothetical protein